MNRKRNKQRLFLKKAGLVFCGLLLSGLFISCASLRTANTSQRDTIIRVAKNMLDKPYAYGAQDESVGFDCSGLTQYAYAKAGISIPRTSKAQYAKAEKISYDSAQEADLLFFSTKGSGASHVGIYLGGGKFIHSPSAGKKVQIVDFENSYWRRNFVGAGTYKQ